MTGDDRVLLGVLTPSSNTRLEPLTARLLDGLPEVSAHFSRFRVLNVGLEAVGQFEPEPILAAADLLADAQVGSMVWSGTSGAWQGIDADHRLCAAITERTGIPATTSTLALLEACRRNDVGSVGLVTPYPDDMHETVARNLTSAGATVTVSQNHGVTASNWELSLIGPDVLTDMVATVAAGAPDVITTFCTNLPSADLVPGWEASYGIPVYDSVSLAVWHALDIAGVDTARITGWGSLFG